MTDNNDTKCMTDDWCRNSPDMVAQSAQYVDTKMVGVLAAGSVVIGIAATAASDNLKSSPEAFPMDIAVLFYVVILVSALVSLIPREFREPTNPEALRKYWKHDPKIVREWHSDLVLKSYRLNISILEKKAKMLNCGLVALAGETVAIISWMALQTLT